jgi:hypothetical protein
MALWRNIGGLTTIGAGQPQYWEYSYPPDGRDVGVAIGAPNILEEAIDIELVAVEQGVVARQSSDGGGPAIHYTVRIQNLTGFDISYNLNIGDWQ